MRCAFQFVLAIALAFAAAVHAKTLDGIAAKVNGAIILESDVVDESAFACMVAGSGCVQDAPEAKRAALDRLIDRELLREQMKGVTFRHTNPAEVQKKLAELETQLGSKNWPQVFTHFGFTEDATRSRIQAELDLLRFVDSHFRPGIQIESAAIARYYREQFLPKLVPGATPPPLDEVSAEIRELLVQQEINRQLAAWLATLRQQSTIEVH
jgi:hypothetical protein